MSNAPAPSSRSRGEARESVRGAQVAFATTLLAVTLSTAGCTTARDIGSDRASPSSTDACAGWSTADYASARVIRRIRVYTDPKTGDSAMEQTTLEPKSTPLMKTGTILREYDFGPAKKVQIVVGPPDFEIPLHPAPYRESFLVLKGSIRMKLGNGQQFDLLPGDMTDFEDTTAAIGHGGRTGRCGYVSLDIVPER